MTYLRSQAFCLVLAAFMIAAVSSAVPAADTDEMVTRIQKAYETLNDMQGTFVQKNIIKELKKSDTYTGEFFIKRPLKMKWAYKGKAAQDLIINNQTVLIYKKGDPQAYRSPFNKDSHGQTPVALLTGMGSIRDEFIVAGKGNRLVLKPKKPMPGVASITLAIADTGFPIRGFTIEDGRSNVVEIELNNIVINPGLKDSVFDPHLPKGVQIYEQQP